MTVTKMLEVAQGEPSDLEIELVEEIWECIDKHAKERLPDSSVGSASKRS
jgi:hypothetical protein